MASRVVTDPEVLSGAPVIEGTLVSVSLLLEQLARGDSIDDVVTTHPELDREDVAAAVQFAAAAMAPRPGPRWVWQLVRWFDQADAEGSDPDPLIVFEHRGLDGVTRVRARLRRRAGWAIGAALAGSLAAGVVLLAM